MAVEESSSATAAAATTDNNDHFEDDNDGDSDPDADEEGREETFHSSLSSYPSSPTTPTTTITRQQQRNRTTKTNIPVVACAWLASLTTGGTTYSFSLIGNELKHSLHLSQSQLDTISAVFFLSGLLSFIPGGFADRYGTRFGISAGGITGCLSLVSYWFISKGYIPFISNNPSLVVAVLSIVGMSVFLSCACVTGSVFKIISCQCYGPGSKGSAVGVAKGYVGLGSGVYAILFESIRGPSMSDLDFLLLAAFFFITAATIPSFVALPDKYRETHDRLPDVFTPFHFRLLYGSLFLLAVIIIMTSLEELYADEHHHDREEDRSEISSSSSKSSTTTNYPLAFTILVVWIGPIIAQLYLPQRSNYYVAAATRTNDDNHNQYHDHRSDASDDFDDDSNNHDGLLLSSSSADDVDGGHAVRSRPPRHTNSEENISAMGIALDTIDESPTATSVNTIHLPRESLPPDEIVSDDDDDDDDDDEETPAMLSGRQNRDGHIEHEHDKNLYQMLQTPTAWLMLWTGTILAGGGTVETNNLGQMVESLGFNSVVTPAALALFSVAQSGGRVITGALSEAALSVNTSRCCIDRGIPRPFFFTVASLVSALAHTILALATEEVSFILGIFLSGVAFGSIWPLLVLCCGEFFGTDHVGANYMFYDGGVSAAGTFLLAKVVAQQVYESHIDPHASENGGENTCYGQGCFQMTHTIIVFLSLTCVVTSVAIQRKTAHIYDKRAPNLPPAGGH